MAQRTFQETEQLKEARKLRELFKGRFSEEESLELLKQHGTLPEAVDFVLNGEPGDIRKFINDRNEALVDSLQRDSEYVNTALQEGMEARIRLFACEPCDRYWWRKVPARKEVSKCRLCRVKYDPVPRHEEWGLGEFVCVCGNVFWGTAWMNHTQSPCYQCGFVASPKQILPPTRPHDQKNMRGRHSCTGRNCYNRARGTPSFLSEGGREERVERRGGRERDLGRNGDGRFAWNSSFFSRTDNDAPVCPHEQSVRGKRVLFASDVHVSTGSTVNTFMSQGELAEDYEDLTPMARVLEVEED